MKRIIIYPLVVVAVSFAAVQLLSSPPLLGCHSSFLEQGEGVGDNPPNWAGFLSRMEALTESQSSFFGVQETDSGLRVFYRDDGTGTVLALDAEGVSKGDENQSMVSKDCYYDSLREVTFQFSRVVDKTLSPLDASALRDEALVKVVNGALAALSEASLVIEDYQETSFLEQMTTDLSERAYAVSQSQNHIHTDLSRQDGDRITAYSFDAERNFSVWQYYRQTPRE